MADAIEIFTNSASERIEVVTSGAQGIQGPAGAPGPSYDQSLNTTDAVAFAELSTGTIRSPGDDCQILLSDQGVDFQSPLFNFSHPSSARTALGLGTAATADSGDFATAAQGALADTAVQPESAPTFSGLDIIDANPSMRIAQSALGGADVSINDTSVKFGDGTYTHILQRQGTLAANATFTLPTSTGTLALTSDIPTTFAASAITSGTLNNARINWAAPSAIGGTTAAAGTFTSLAATGLSLAAGSLSASAPFDLSQTWNNSGVTFTGIKFNVTDTASNAASLLQDWQAGGVTKASIRKDGMVYAATYLCLGAAGEVDLWCSGSTGAATRSVSSGRSLALTSLSLNLPANGHLSFNSVTASTGADAANGGAADLFLYRDAANTLAQRNGTNAQAFRVYNTYTSSTNYERGFLKWDSNVLKIGTEKGSGGGTARALEFQTDGTTRLTIAAAGGVTGDILTSSSGNLWINDTRISRRAQGILQIDQGSYSKLNFGGSTASYPSLKQSSATLQARLADDSAYTTLDAQLRMQGTAPASATATGTAGDIRYDGSYVYICSATNTWVRAALATW